MRCVKERAGNVVGMNEIKPLMRKAQGDRLAGSRGFKELAHDLSAKIPGPVSVVKLQRPHRKAMTRCKESQHGNERGPSRSIEIKRMIELAFEVLPKCHRENATPNPSLPHRLKQDRSVREVCVAEAANVALTAADAIVASEMEDNVGTLFPQALAPSVGVGLYRKKQPRRRGRGLPSVDGGSRQRHDAPVILQEELKQSRSEIARCSGDHGGSGRAH
jgi:hypothetical protein